MTEPEQPDAIETMSRHLANGQGCGEPVPCESGERGVDDCWCLAEAQWMLRALLDGGYVVLTDAKTKCDAIEVMVKASLDSRRTIMANMQAEDIHRLYMHSAFGALVASGYVVCADQLDAP